MKTMDKNKKCTCPICNQAFKPSEGLTPEEHIAKGIIRVFAEMQKDPFINTSHCPRCGHRQMEPELEHNAISRQIDVYVCNDCGIDEALNGTNNNKFSLVSWSIVSEILKNICGLKCENYIPEKGNPYPLCDNKFCKDSKICNISAHLEDDGGYDRYDK